MLNITVADMSLKYHSRQKSAEWVSEQILNGTSTQLGYTVPFTSLHVWKYFREDKSKTDTTKTKDYPEKANNTKCKRKLAWFSRFLGHSASKRGGLILQCSQAQMGQKSAEQRNRGCVILHISVIMMLITMKSWLTLVGDFWQDESKSLLHHRHNCST